MSRKSITSCPSESEENLHFQVSSQHLFRYASEWDPRAPGHTKGGYLQGKLKLPTGVGDLRVVFSTVADQPLALDETIRRDHPELENVHPTILFIIRKGKGNRRMTNRETIPNHRNWKQELYIINRCVKIRNFITEADESRYDDIQPLTKVDDMFMLGQDMTLNLGRGQDELNMVILIPKTESRSAEKEVTINSVMADRLNDPELVEHVLANFNKKSSTNIKRLKLKYEIFSLDSNKLLMEGFSNSICDSSSKEHGILDFTEINVKSCCGLGGRKIFMISQGLLAQDVEPRFQLFDPDGNRLEKMEYLLSQPSRDITILKEMIIFIAPQQKNIEFIFSNKWEIKLVGVRVSDNMESTTKFSFQYFPHDFYDPCIFCSVKPDGISSTSSSLPPPISPAKPGLRKRKIEDGESKEKKTSPGLSRSNSVPETMPSLTAIRHDNPPELETVVAIPPSLQTKASKTTTLPLRATDSIPTSSIPSVTKTVNLLKLRQESQAVPALQSSIYTSPQSDSVQPGKIVSPVSVIKYHNKGQALTTTAHSDSSRRNSLKTLHNIFRATNGFKSSKKTVSPPVSPLNDLVISTGNVNKMLYTHPQSPSSRSVSSPAATESKEKNMPELMNILKKPRKSDESVPFTRWHSPVPPVIRIEDEPEPILIKIEDD